MTTPKKQKLAPHEVRAALTRDIGYVLATFLHHLSEPQDHDEHFNVDSIVSGETPNHRAMQYRRKAVQQHVAHFGTHARPDRGYFMPHQEIWNAVA